MTVPHKWTQICWLASPNKSLSLINMLLLIKKFSFICEGQSCRVRIAKWLSAHACNVLWNWMWGHTYMCMFLHAAKCIKCTCLWHVVKVCYYTECEVTHMFMFLAALQMVFSVCLSVPLSVRLSVTPFWLCSHHRIIMKFSGVITNDQSKVHAKGQGNRGHNPT